jgi:hypothetical protein
VGEAEFGSVAGASLERLCTSLEIAGKSPALSLGAKQGRSVLRPYKFLLDL